MWGLSAAALWNAAAMLQQKDPSNGLQLGRTWWRALVHSFEKLWKNRTLAVLTLLLLAPALSIFWSEDLDYWLRVTRVRLPFLVLPWAFANLPALSAQDRNKVLYLLVWFMVLVCLGVGSNFLLHYDTIIEGLGHGRPIPVPRQHVRFSLVLATAIVTGAWLWRQRFYLKFRWERHALAFAVAFLFIFIHILSVRSGLAVLYVALAVSIIWYVGQTKRWMAGALMLTSLVILLWAAVSTIPSLQQRVAYMRYDWEQYLADDGVDYSDAERWVSLKVGYEIWLQNPILGTGAGDLMTAVETVTETQYSESVKTPKLPHNQWLLIMASTGIVGLALSMIAFFVPVFARKNRSNYLFITFQIMAFSTFLIECTVESAIGVSWYLFYTLWFGEIMANDEW